MNGEAAQIKYPESHVFMVTCATCIHASHMKVQCGDMATIKVNASRFCSDTVLPKLWVGLFSKDGLENICLEELAEW